MSDQNTSDQVMSDQPTDDQEPDVQQEGPQQDEQTGDRRPTDHIRVHYYNSVVHPLITIFVPFWFFLTNLLVIIEGAISVGSDAVVFPPFYAILLLLVGISETVTGNMLYKERIGSILPRLRELVFVVIFGYLFILLLHGDLLRGNFNIGRLKVWLPLLILGVEWFLCYYIHQKLRERELFLQFFTGKSPKETRETYQSFMHEGGESLNAAKSVKRLTIVLTVIGFIVFNAISLGFNLAFRGWSLIIILIFFGGNFLVVGVLNTWNEVQFNMMDGLIVHRPQRRFRLGLIVLLFLAVFLVAIPLTGSNPLLPERYIAAFFDWLQSIGRFEPPDTEIEAPDFEMETPEYETGDYLGDATRQLGQQENLGNITRIIGYILLGVLGIGAVVFLLAPLLKRDREGNRNIGLALRQGLDKIRQAVDRFVASINNLLEAIKNRRKSRVWDRIRARGSGGRLQQTLERAAEKVGLSRRERRINNRMLRAFFRFTKWGEKRGVPFTLSLGPAEYAEKVERESPSEVGGECLDIAGMFEEALYSNHTIEESFRSEFYDKVKRVVKTK